MIRSHDAQTEASLVATFRLGEALLGIGAEQVQEVVRVGDITRVHHAPPYVVGIRNLRGRIVTVIDLALRLELGGQGRSAESRLLIVEWHGEPLGLLVDAVTDTLSLGADDLMPPPANVSGVQGRFLRGVCRQGDRLVALLAPDAVLEPESSALGAPPDRLAS
jgi:purine-binding chemotaxis protein CheW